jgi:hypothetical protein
LDPTQLGAAAIGSVFYDLRNKDHDQIITNIPENVSKAELKIWNVLDLQSLLAICPRFEA